MTGDSLQVLTLVQKAVQNRLDKWHQRGKWAWPGVTDCLDFIVTEIAEAIEARLRLNSDYVRNNPQAEPIAYEDIDREVADVLFMCLVWFIIRKQHAGQVLAAKLEAMELKRQ